MGKQLREEDFDHIKDVIDSLTGSSEFEAERLKICDETWAHRGESASLVVDYMTRPVEKPEDKKAEPKKKAKKKKA